MRIFRQYPKQLVYLSLLFLIVNLLQAYFTDLVGDEAYYWRYSKDLAWGYFDHPPMIALFIKIGYSLFPNELGVRFITVLLSFVSIFLVWEFIEGKEKLKIKNILLFFLIYVSMPVFNIYGFIATPDVPLIFFSLLYIHIFIKFKKQTSIKYASLLGIVAALLLYSKYHGVIVIIISIISQFKVLKKKEIWLAGFIGFLLFFPHLLWQYNNDFPSIRYHLAERNVDFKIKYIYEYILNVVLILNPLFVVLFLNKINRKPLKFIEYKFFKLLFWFYIVFFLFSTLKGHVGPHWIAVSAIPFTLFFYNRAFNNISRQKSIILLSTVSIILLLFFRLALIVDFLPVKTEFHNRKEKMEFIKEKADTLPVIFLDSYVKASLYEFYITDKTYSMNSVWYRKNQFNIWNVEEIYNNQKVFLVSNSNINHTEYYIFKPQDTVFYNVFENFITAEKLELSCKPLISVTLNDSINEFEIYIKNPYPYPVILNKKKNKLKIFIIVYSEDRLVENCRVKVNLPEKIDKFSEINVNAFVQFKNIPEGHYQYYISFIQKNLPPLYNSESLDLVILKDY